MSQDENAVTSLSRVFVRRGKPMTDSEKQMGRCCKKTSYTQRDKSFKNP